MKLPRVSRGKTTGSDLMIVMRYRPELFGRPFVEWIQRLLRGASDWTVGERELLAAFVSKVNRCAYCLGSHQAVAHAALGRDVVEATLADHRSAPISPQLRATLTFIERLTKDPASVGPEDAAAARTSGVSESALEVAVHICAAFCIINRVADALGFEVQSMTEMDRTGRLLLQHGYRID